MEESYKDKLAKMTNSNLSNEIISKYWGNLELGSPESVMLEEVVKRLTADNNINPNINQKDLNPEYAKMINDNFEKLKEEYDDRRINKTIN